ncbi:MAG: hypothetical protein HC877_22115 [Thioploca sp.]|nr:hypothetical protein [Thioploca sp.]
MNQRLKYSLISLSIVNLLASTVFASNIDSDHKYAWSSTTGWLNFQPSHGGVTVYPDHLEGDAWSEQSGWIQLGSYSGGGSYHYENTSSTNWGVNQDSIGQLSGYAWSDALGWINFNPSHDQVIINQESGDFQGSAWSEIGGWIQFKQDEAPTYKVRYNSTKTSTVTEPLLPPTTLLPPTISNEVTGSPDQEWRTITNEVSIPENTSINHVIFENDVTNAGLVSNFKVGPDATFEGGTVTGYITNAGTIANVDFVGAKLSGGTLSGNIINSGQGIIENVQLAPNTTITDGKIGGTITGDSSNTLRDVQLTAGTTILSGVQLSGDISGDPNQPVQLDDTIQIAPDTKLSYVILGTTMELPDNVELGPGVTLLIDPDKLTAEQVAQIPPPLFAILSAEQLAKFSKDAVSGIRPEQLAYLPLKNLGGLTRNNMGGLSTTVLHDMTPKQVVALNKAEFKRMSSQDVSKLLVNFDKDQISPQDVEQLIPSGWQLDLETGALKPPVGAQLTLTTLPNSLNSPSSPVQIPEIIDIEKGMGLGGAGTSLKAGMESSMEQQHSLANEDLTEFVLSQEENGILLVKGIEDSSSVGKKYTFTPDTENVIQVDTDEIPIGLSIGIDGFYIITTPDGQQFRVIPAPQDPVMLSQALDGGEVVMGQSGDVLMNNEDAVIFDPEVKKNANGQEPGIYLEGNHGYIVYKDGSTQAFNSSFLQPDTFKETAMATQLDLQNLTFHMDGSFTGSQAGGLYIIKPNLKVEVTHLKEGESVEPDIKRNGNILTYTLVMNYLRQPNTRKRMTRSGNDRGGDRITQTGEIKGAGQNILEEALEEIGDCLDNDCVYKLCRKKCEKYNDYIVDAAQKQNCNDKCPETDTCFTVCPYFDNEQYDECKRICPP